MRPYRCTAAFALAAMLFAVIGCESGPKTVSELQPTLSLSTTSNRILQGETTTIFASTSNLLGRQADINWTTTLGQVTPAENGRIARFTSDVPGTAVVTAELNVDGSVLRQSTNVTVNSMR